MSAIHRRFSRKQLDVRFHGSDAEGNGRLSFEGGDLSEGGAFLKSDLLLESAQRLQVTFQLPGMPQRLCAQARVAWVRRFPEPHQLPGMGVEFLALSESDRRTLASYLGF